jgi:hypothetical protein
MSALVPGFLVMTAQDDRRIWIRVAMAAEALGGGMM